MSRKPQRSRRRARRGRPPAPAPRPRRRRRTWIVLALAALAALVAAPLLLRAPSSGPGAGTAAVVPDPVTGDMQPRVAARIEA
ncbi:MAG: hypothetical protein ACYTG1_09420, partial [Planctomycetota bacterium]